MKNTQNYLWKLWIKECIGKIYYHTKNQMISFNSFIARRKIQISKGTETDFNILFMLLLSIFPALTLNIGFFSRPGSV